MHSESDTQVGRIVAAAAIAIGCLMLVPFEPGFVSRSESTSWALRIAADLAEGRQFGLDTVFNYGPLGLIPLRIYFPGTYPVLLAGSALVAGAFIWSSFLLFARDGRSRAASSILTLLLVALATSQLHRVGTEPLFNLLIAFVPLLDLDDEHRTPPTLQVLLGVALAIAALGKFNYFVGGTGVALAAAFTALAGRRPAWLSISYAGSILLLWRGTGQQFAHLPQYLGYSLESARGYAEAMSLQGEAQDAVPFAVLAIALTLAHIISRPKAERFAASLFPRLALIFWLFLVFKTAVVRQDEHVLSASLTVLGAGLLLVASTRRDSRLAMLAGSASIMTALLAVAISVAALGDGILMELEQTAALTGRQAKAFVRSLSEPGWRAERHRDNLAAVAKANPFPAIRGPVDVLPFASVLPWAHHLESRPNPTVNCYDSAHSSVFAKLQARHLSDPNAPLTLIASLETVDERYPSLDYGLSLMEMLARYEIASRTGEALILSKRPEVRRLELDSIATLTVRPGEFVDLPSALGGGEMVWASVRLQGTPTRILLSTFYRSPEIRLTVRLHDGDTLVRRLIPGGGESGFLLSPYLDDVGALAEVLSGKVDPRRTVSGISIDAERSALPYLRSAVIELYAIRARQ
ncbi:MAG: hypothetical protein WC538_05495 [Thermoanaerobaculia bacterium]|jgi:hypothetical protein